MTRTTRSRRRPRPAFTLIELLVVIAIIALLVSLSTAAYQRARINAMVRTSEDVVAKVQMGLDNQVKIIADKVRQEQLNQSEDFCNLRDDFCSGPAPENSERAAAVLMYCRLRQYLPQTTAELSSPGFTLGSAKPVTFRRPLAFNAISSISDTTADKVAAAALFAALTAQTQGGNSFAADEALSGAQMDITVTSGATVRVFKDGWGNPIPFTRFYQSTEFDAPPYCDGKYGTGAAPGKDPFDSLGRIYAWGSGNKTTLQSTLGYSSWGHNTSAVAYSWGLDKNPGTGDEILGYRLRSIGAKGGPKQ